MNTTMGGDAFTFNVKNHSHYQWSESVLCLNDVTTILNSPMDRLDMTVDGADISNPAVTHASAADRSSWITVYDSVVASAVLNSSK